MLGMFVLVLVFSFLGFILFVMVLYWNLGYYFVFRVLIIIMFFFIIFLIFRCVFKSVILILISIDIFCD